MEEQVMEEPVFNTGVRISLRGPGGNSFAILGKADQAMRRAGATFEQRARMQMEAISGDYEHLLETVKKWTGAEFVR